MATYKMFMPYGEYPGQYLPGHWAVDYNPALGELLDGGKYIKSTSAQAIYRMYNGVDFVISGKGLSYDGHGVLAGGTITSLKLIDTDERGVIQEITGLSWAGSSFKSAVIQGDSWITAATALSGADKLVGSSGDDELWAFAGNDTLIGGSGSDNLVGGRGKDTYDGGGGSKFFDQLSFDDTYSDAKGAKGVVVDMATGKATDPWGNAETFQNIERIRGTQFSDKMSGSASADQFRGMGGADKIDGRGGVDMVLFDRDIRRGGNQGITVDLTAGYAIDGFGDKDALKSIENVLGSQKNDILNGSSGANALNGGQGNDRIWGGLGADTLWGADGSDRFIFKSVKESTSSARDTLDLTSNDVVDLHAIDANSKTSGNQDFKWIGMSEFHGVAGELRYTRSNAETHVHADVDGDKKADFAFDVVGDVALKSSQFDL